MKWIWREITECSGRFVCLLHFTSLIERYQCDGCRSRKIRCDRAVPCSNCKSSKLSMYSTAYRMPRWFVNQLISAACKTTAPANKPQRQRVHISDE